ncbi:hypothetical protein ABG768_022730 [Culter alburnus]|uniref:Tetratricopeptide repeat protein 33 n=1 Tax=Culter alburnus TaxID=194366 RepID=A0AAW2AP38_CULAL
MASFGWKRKVGERVSKTTVQQFQQDSEQVDDEDDVEKEGVDWLHVIKRRREVLLEDCAAKSKRLKDEGTLLAEQGRNWEALKRWDDALQLTPDDAVLYEMKSQLCAGTAQTNCIFQREHYGHTVLHLHSGWKENSADLDTGHDNTAHLSINKWCHLADAFSCLNVGKAPLSLRVFLKSTVVLEKGYYSMSLPH